MDKTNYQEAATNHAKEYLDMLLRMESALGQSRIWTGKDRQQSVIAGND